MRLCNAGAAYGVCDSRASLGSCQNSAHLRVLRQDRPAKLLKLCSNKLPREILRHFGAARRTPVTRRLYGIFIKRPWRPPRNYMAPGGTSSAIRKDRTQPLMHVKDATVTPCV